MRPRGEGEGDSGESENKRWSHCGVGGKFRQSRRGGGGQDGTSLHGFHVGEIHLLELIKI